MRWGSCMQKVVINLWWSYKTLIKILIVLFDSDGLTTPLHFLHWKGTPQRALCHILSTWTPYGSLYHILSTGEAPEGKTGQYTILHIGPAMRALLLSFFKHGESTSAPMLVIKYCRYQLSSFLSSFSPSVHPHVFIHFILSELYSFLLYFVICFLFFFN